MAGNNVLGFDAKSKVDNILGNKGTFPARRSSLRPASRQQDTSEVVMKIRQLLDRLPEVERASGTLTIKLKNRTPKTLSFRYR